MIKVGQKVFTRYMGCSYITPYKAYVVTEVVTEGLFHINLGDIAPLVKLTRCAHLSGGNWELVNE